MVSYPGRRIMSDEKMVLLMIDVHLPTVPSLSHQASSIRPGRKTLCSMASKWQSLLLQTFDQPGCVDRFETASSPDYLLVLSLKGTYNLESFSGASWKKATYRPGVGGITSPMMKNRLRWHGTTPTVQVLRVCIPEFYFLEAGEEYRRAGAKLPWRLPDALQFTDPTVFAVAESLAEQVQLGAPNLYAEAGARFLAAHLLLKLNRPADQTKKRSAGAELTDKRLKRVLEFMENNFARDLSLQMLADEAGISLFHFTRLFKAKVGVTPHRHVVLLRMQHARSLLRRTDLSITQVALESGYAHLGHFAAAFKRESGLLPKIFRRDARL